MQRERAQIGVLITLNKPTAHMVRDAAGAPPYVGADGRVKDVSVDRAVTGNTAAVVSAIQRWRFKPATENGQPIAAPYSVEISFKRE